MSVAKAFIATADFIATGRDNILVFELDDFHLSLGILFHVCFPPFSRKSLCETAVTPRHAKEGVARKPDSGHNLTCLLACFAIIAICFIMSSPRFRFGKNLCQRPLQGKGNRAGQTAETVCPFLKSTHIELPAVTWTGGVIGSAAPAANAGIHAIAAAAGRNNVLGFKLDDFHLSLGILFHVCTPPFAENFYVKQLLYRVTRKVSSPGEVLPHRSALFSAMRCRFFAWILTGILCTPPAVLQNILSVQHTFSDGYIRGNRSRFCTPRSAPSILENFG